MHARTVYWCKLSLRNPEARTNHSHSLNIFTQITQQTLCYLLACTRLTDRTRTLPGLSTVQLYSRCTLPRTMYTSSGRVMLSSGRARPNLRLQPPELNLNPGSPLTAVTANSLVQPMPCPSKRWSYDLGNWKRIDSAQYKG